MEQFVEGRPFADEELDVVDKQNVDRAIFLAEAGQCPSVEGREEFSCELLGGQSNGVRASRRLP